MQWYICCTSKYFLVETVNYLKGSYFWVERCGLHPWERYHGPVCLCLFKSFHMWLSSLAILAFAPRFSLRKRPVVFFMLGVPCSIFFCWWISGCYSWTSDPKVTCVHIQTGRIQYVSILECLIAPKSSVCVGWWQRTCGGSFCDSVKCSGSDWASCVSQPVFIQDTGMYLSPWFLRRGNLFGICTQHRKTFV